MNIKTFLKSGLTALFLILFFTRTAYSETEILGWLESAWLLPWSAKVKAKLDSGAKTSSIHAQNIVPFEKNGERWVSFTLPNPIGKSVGFKNGIQLEKPVVREIKVKEHNGTNVSRYVVEIEFCMNGKNYITPASLVDRDNFNYPLLLGRSTLKDHLLIDPAKIFISNKSCLDHE